MPVTRTSFPGVAVVAVVKRWRANRLNGTPHSWAARSTAGRHVEVNTVGTRSNRDGCGARIVAAIKGARVLREVLCGSEGLSGGSDKVLHFGLGPGVNSPPDGHAHDLAALERT